MIHFAENILNRFWKFVNKNGPIPAHVSGIGNCWEWDGRTLHNYGSMFFDGKNHYSHRVSWKIHYGEIPTGMKVCHKCDNTRCVRPDHLFTGTQGENIADKVRKGRQSSPRGERCHLSKLSSETVLMMRRLHAGGDSAKTISKTLLVPYTTVWGIVNRTNWKHLT